MPGIAQIQLKYFPVADRLLLRVSTTDQAEFRFWLTRRLVRHLWPALVNQLAVSTTTQIVASAEVKREVLAFEHANVVDNANFSTPFQNAAKAFPLGQEPQLIQKVSLRSTLGDSKHLGLTTEQGASVDLALSKTLGHSLCELLGRVLVITDWDVSSPIPVSRTPTATSAMN